MTEVLTNRDHGFGHSNTIESILRLLFREFGARPSHKEDYYKKRDAKYKFLTRRSEANFETKEARLDREITRE